MICLYVQICNVIVESQNRVLEGLKIPWKLDFNIKDKQIFGKSLRKNSVCNGSGMVSKALELCFGENVLLHNNFFAS